MIGVGARPGPKPLQYVRDYYQVPAQIGMRVEVAGKPGKITTDEGAHIGVRFDDGAWGACHPTWRVRYFGSDGQVLCDTTDW